MTSCLFDTGQLLLVDFDLCASTRLVFCTRVSRCWSTLACAFPLVLSILTLVNRCWWTLALCAPNRLVFVDIGQALLADFDLCAPTRLVFFDISCTFCRLSRVIQPTTGWGYTLLPTVAAKKLVGLCKRARAPWRRRYGKSLTPNLTLTLTLTPTCCRLYNPRLPVKKCNPNLLSVV